MASPTDQASVIPVSVAVVHDPRDGAMYKELDKHLAPLRRLKLITITAVQGGDDLGQLPPCELILILVSGNLLDSEKAYAQVEVALSRRQSGTRVVPILVRPVDFRGLPFDVLAPLPRNHQPVSEWSYQDTAWYEVAQGIRTVVDTLQRDPARKVVPPAQPATAAPVPVQVAQQAPAQAPTQAAGVPAGKLTRNSLRKLLNTLLISDSDLDMFCGDFFAAVRQRFARGMERPEKVTLLLDYAVHEEVLRRLRQEYPDRVAAADAQGLIQYE